MTHSEMPEHFTKLVRALTGAGLDSLLAEHVVKEPRLAHELIAWLREQLPAAPDYSGLFAPLDVQLENIRGWNERGWGFTKADFDAIDLTPMERRPDCLVTDVIVPYLPDLGGVDGATCTFNELWEVLEGEQERRGGRCCRIHTQTPLPPKDHVPGLCRVAIDLGANRGVHPLSARRHPYMAHLEVLAAAGQHPKWVRAMENCQVPYVFMAGYRGYPSPSYMHDYVPLLYATSDTISLGSTWNTAHDPNWACPEIVIA
jgi:hypothetical protein